MSNAMRAIQKIRVQGNSATVTIPRPMLYVLDLRPGDFVEFVDQGDGSALMRPWNVNNNVTKRSPGVVPEHPTIGTK